MQLDVKGEEVRRKFEVLYLDERVRVAQFLSNEEPEPVYFVFKRAGAGSAEVRCKTQWDRIYCASESPAKLHNIATNIINCVKPSSLKTSKGSVPCPERCLFLSRPLRKVMGKPLRN